MKCFLFRLCTSCQYDGSSVCCLDAFVKIQKSAFFTKCHRKTTSLERASTTTITMPAKKTLPENALTTAKTISAKKTSREKTPTTTITTAKKKD